MKQLRNSNRQHELDSLMTGTSCEDSDAEEVIVKPQAQVQPMRLTFNENNEFILVPDEEHEARVQRLTFDEEKECVLVIQDQ